MPERRARWGALLLVTAGALSAGMAVTAAVTGAHPSATLDRIILPAAALAFGILALAAGHVSYPRVQNLQVYLAGYSIGLQSIVVSLFVGFSRFLGGSIPAAPAGYLALVYLLAILLAACCSVVPPFPTYRVTRITTLTLVALQLTVLVAARFLVAPVGPVIGWLVPAAPVSPPALAATGLVTGVVLVNAFRRSQSFYLRGALSGVALLAGGAWILPAILESMAMPAAPDLVALLFAVIVSLYFAASTLAHVLARMEHRVSYDPLLQIYNRQYCNQILAEQSCVGTRPPFAVMMVDIDHFKQVNDTHGHQAGDRILFAVAQMVQKSVVPEGVVCRYGGEELIVFFPGRTARDILPLAQRMRAGIEQMETPVRSKRVRVTVSVGISDRRALRYSLEHVVNAADKALYLAKENGRNQVRFVRIKAAGAVTRRASPQAKRSPRRRARSGR